MIVASSSPNRPPSLACGFSAATASRGSLPQSVLREDRRTNLTAGDSWTPELNFGIVSVRRTLGEHWTVSANAFVRALEAEQFNVNLIAENSELRNRTLSVGGTLEVIHRGKIAERDNVLILGAEYTRHDVHSRTFEGPTGAQTLTANLTDTEDAVGVFAQDSLVLARDVFLDGCKLDGEGYTLGEQVQYTDIWANDNYLQFMYERLLLLKSLLSGTASIYVHVDARRCHSLRSLLDEVFGIDAFRNQISWKRTSAHGGANR